MGYYDCPEPSLDPPDGYIVGYCCKCGGEIYYGEPTVLEDGTRMCVDCFQDYVKEILRDSPDIMADYLGMKYEEAY